MISVINLNFQNPFYDLHSYFNSNMSKQTTNTFGMPRPSNQSDLRLQSVYEPSVSSVSIPQPIQQQQQQNFQQYQQQQQQQPNTVNPYSSYNSQALNTYYPVNAPVPMPQVQQMPQMHQMQTNNGLQGKLYSLIWITTCYNV
jgi:hypothetical protein